MKIEVDISDSVINGSAKRYIEAQIEYCVRNKLGSRQVQAKIRSIAADAVHKFLEDSNTVSLDTVAEILNTTVKNEVEKRVKALVRNL